jgi:hypothetical protein
MTTCGTAFRLSHIPFPTSSSHLLRTLHWQWSVTDYCGRGRHDQYTMSLAPPYTSYAP